MQVPGGYHIWCVGSLVPKGAGVTISSGEVHCSHLSLVVATCEQLKDACESGAHAPGRNNSLLIDCAKVLIVSCMNILPSELAHVIRQAADLIQPQARLIHVFTFDCLSWQLQQLLNHGFFYICVEQNTPNGQF